MKNLRKFFAVSVMALTIIMTSGVAAPAGAAAQAGDLIKKDGLSTVYYLGADGKRYVFPNDATYFSWYKDFSGVVTVSATELSSYPLGANVVMRAGTKLVKITTDPSVYAVEANGVLRKIQSEADAIALYGATWAKRVIDVADSFFTNYTIGTPLSAGLVPAGSLVKVAGNSAIYYFDGATYRSVATEAAFNANRFDFSNVTTVSAIGALGTPISGAEEMISKTSQAGVTGGVQPGQGTGLTVSLSSDTAPSNSVVTTATGGQAVANLASFNLTAANDGAVNITSIKIKRTGISSDSTLSNIYLYEGNTKLTDGGSLSNGYVTFANNVGVINIAAGTTKKITVKADIAANATGNIGVSINAASDIVAAGVTVSGSFPMSGNLMSVVTATDLATVAAGAVTGSGNINAGTMNATLWSAPLTIGNKSVRLNYVSFKQIGSISTDSIQNIKLYVDGVVAGSVASINSDNRVNFDLASAPVLMGTGARTLELRGDIIKGSNSTFSFSIQTASDIVVTDTNYNVTVASTGLPKTTASATINTGTLVISADPTFSSTQVVKNAANITLAKYTMKAYGENMKVTSLNAVELFNLVMGTNDGISDLALYVNGSQVGSSQNVLNATGATTTNFTGTKTFGTTNLFTVDAGATATVEIRGTLTMNSVNTTATSITSSLAAVAQAYQGVTSYATTPAAGIGYTAKTLTIQATGLSALSKNNSFGNTQTVVSNVQKQKIGSFVFQAGSSEAVRVTNVAVTVTSTGAMVISDVSNLYISETPTNVIGNPVATPSVNNFPVDFVVSAGQTKNIDVFADIALTTGTFNISDLTVSARTNVTSLSANASIAGQTLTFAAGSVATSTVTLVSANAPAALITGGTVATAAAYKFVATNGDAKIQSLKFAIHGANGTTAEGTSINSLTIGAVNAPVVLEGSDYVAYFDKTLNINIPVGLVGATIEVKANYNTVGNNAVVTRTQSKLALTNYTYQVGSSAPVDSATIAVQANAMTSVAAAPIVTLNAYNPTSKTLNIGTQEVLRFDVTASNGPINLKQFVVTPLFSGASTTTVAGVYDITDLSTNLITPTGANLVSGATSSVVLINDNLITTSQTKTFVVKVNVGGLGAAQSNNFTLSLTSADAYDGSTWQWNDATAVTYGGGYLVKTLPVNGYSFNY